MSVLLYVFGNKAGHGVKSLAKEYAKDTGAITDWVWILLFCLCSPSLHTSANPSLGGLDQTPETPFPALQYLISLALYDKAPKRLRTPVHHNNRISVWNSIIQRSLPSMFSTIPKF